MDKMGKSVFEKSKRETQAIVVISEQKMKGYTDFEISSLKEESIQNNRQTVDVLRTEVSKDFQSVHLKIVDLQK